VIVQCVAITAIVSTTLTWSAALTRGGWVIAPARVIIAPRTAARRTHPPDHDIPPRPVAEQRHHQPAAPILSTGLAQRRSRRRGGLDTAVTAGWWTQSAWA
jgi:hypothetical protein